MNVVTLDFPSLIERMTQTFDYESILLGLTNVGLDPNEQMNVWLSSASNHQWNPNQKVPATPWEADELPHVFERFHRVAGDATRGRAPLAMNGAAMSSSSAFRHR